MAEEEQKKGARVLVDAWFQKVTLTYLTGDKYFIYTFAPDEAEHIGQLLIDRADKARQEDPDMELPAEEPTEEAEEEEEPDATE